MPPAHRKAIHLDRAAANNLKAVTLDLPHEEIVALTGPSGSGKSSLASGILARVSRRRIGRCLGRSADLAAADLPVGGLTGLPPCLELRQEPLRGQSRSSIGSYTGIIDNLAVLFRRYGSQRSAGGETACPVEQTDLPTWLLRHHRGHRVALHAIQEEKEVRSARGLPADDQLIYRVRGEAWRLGDTVEFKKRLPATVEIARPVSERIVRSRDGAASLWQDAGDHPLWLVGENMVIDGRFHLIAADDPQPYDPMTRRLFSFNSSGRGTGRCPSCEWHGRATTIAERDLVAAAQRPVLEDGLALPRKDGRFTHLGASDCILRGLLSSRGLPLGSSWADLPTSVQEVILKGSGDEPIPEQQPGDDKPRQAKRPFAGLQEAIISKSVGSAAARKAFAGLIAEGDCPACGGERFNRSARACTYRGTALTHWLHEQPVAALASLAAEFAEKTEEDERAVWLAILGMLTTLSELGIGYLTLGRGTATLSGGEAQRLRLARSLVWRLKQCCHLLDELSRALHPHDLRGLVVAMRRLRDLGNTLVLIEHNPHLIREASHMVELGPKGGTGGGEVMYEGSPAERLVDEATYEPAPPTAACKADAPALRLKGLTVRNVRNVDLTIPAGRVTVVAGVSGAGKSSAVMDGLVPLVRAALESGGANRGCISELPETIRSIRVVAQRLPDVNRRSVVATAIGVMDALRARFAATPAAAALRLNIGDFSFNAAGGCAVCQGLGRFGLDEREDRPCPTCGGSRFAPPARMVELDGTTLPDLLAITAEELADLNSEAVSTELRDFARTMAALGLGHLSLGRAMPSLSAGERQRLGLVRAMAGTGRATSSLWVLDEPTAGLSTQDAVRVFVAVRGWAERSGSTILATEHKLTLIRRADWVIEFGPGGGTCGGRVVYQGEPGKLGGAATPTGRALAGEIETEPPVGTFDDPSPLTGDPADPEQRAAAFEAVISGDEPSAHLIVRPPSRRSFGWTRAGSTTMCGYWSYSICFRGSGGWQRMPPPTAWSP